MKIYFYSILSTLMIFLSGCATTYDSACHELSSSNKSEIKRRAKSAQKGSYKRHFILVETGSEIASKCRSHYIDEEVFASIPNSLKVYCDAQSKRQDKYCTLYSVDGVSVKDRIY